MSIFTRLLTATFLAFLASFAWSADQGMHDHAMPMGDDESTMPMKHGAMEGKMFMTSVVVDGITLTFHVMPASAAMDHGGSHNLMVKFEGGEVTAANSKVVHPNGAEESKMLQRMGDWWMAGYDLGHPGTHQLMVLFKTADGATHFTGTRYPETAP